MPTNGNDTLIGTPGNDTIDGSFGNDRIDGQSGNDTIFGSYGSDTVLGGDGNDVLYGGDGFAFEASGNDLLDGQDGNDLMYGTSGNDIMFGGSGEDTIESRGGNDVIVAGPGDDIVFIQRFGFDGGNSFDNQIVLGPGRDTLDLGSATSLRVSLYDFNLGNDMISGVFVAGILSNVDADNDGLNDDMIITYTNFVITSRQLALLDYRHETLSGTENSDLLNGSPLDDTMFGLFGNDTVLSNTGNDSVLGGLGDDSLVGDFGNDFLVGGFGNDRLLGGAQNDSLDGGAGTDLLDGSDGLDTLSGGAGNDQLSGGAEGDFLTGGQGRDEFVFSNNAGLDTIADFAQGWDSINAFVIFQSNNLDLDGDGQFDDSRLVHTTGTIILLNQGQSTSAQADFRNGTTIGDTLNGLGGNDTLNGISGNDALLGDAGADSLIGETGDDWLSGGIASDTLDGGDGNDALYGGDGDDLIIGSLGGDFIVGGDGVDTIAYTEVTNNLTINLAQKILTSGDGTFTFLNDFEILNLGIGNDVVIGWGGTYQTMTMGEGNDFFADYSGPGSPGGVSNDRIQAQDGNDALYGLAGDDSLDGGAGIDLVIGGDGADTLIGGAGGDWMGGGAGADVYRYLATGDSNATGGFDAVAQFETGIDRIDLSTIDANTAAGGDQAFTIGALAAGQAGRLQITTTSGYTLVEGDVNGDGIAEIAFFVWSEAGGVAAPAALSAGDFVL